MELKKSTRPDQNKFALDQFLLPLEIVNFDIEAAIEYGRIEQTWKTKAHR